MKVVWGHSAEVQVWVGWRIPYVRMRMERDPDAMREPFGPAQAAGIIDANGCLVAGVVFHNYNPDCPSFEVSFAADTAKWLSRTVICELLRYPFDELHCRRLTAITPRRGTRARRFLDRFGFRREGVATEAFGDDDAIISRLLRREWLATKWAKPLPERRESRVRDHGQTKTAACS